MESRILKMVASTNRNVLRGKYRNVKYQRSRMQILRCNSIKDE
jgi:hypothetical protein